MCETLKGKKHYEVNNPPCRYGEFNYEYFDYEDVKSAVEGATKELEEIVDNGKVINPRAFMKKWFSDVIE